MTSNTADASVLCADIGGTGVRYSAVLGRCGSTRLTRNLVTLGRRAQRHGARGVIFDCRQADPELRLDEIDVVEELHSAEANQPKFKVCYLFGTFNRWRATSITHSVFRRGLEAQCRSFWRDAQLFFGVLGYPDPMETPGAYSFVQYRLGSGRSTGPDDGRRATALEQGG